MNEEWGTPISKEKIISRRNRLIEYQKTQDMRFTVGYQIIDENILDINYMIYEIERLNKRNKEIYEGFMATTKELIEYAEEVERLNNIIKEVRKWLEEDYKITINNEVCDYPRYYLDKFEEILGSDKE